MKLLLFMTRGMSLTAWRDNGSLKRELALYAELARRGVSISIIHGAGVKMRLLSRRSLAQGV